MRKRSRPAKLPARPPGNEILEPLSVDRRQNTIHSAHPRDGLSGLFTIPEPAAWTGRAAVADATKSCNVQKTPPG
jgi:hypothetical protein